MAEISSRARPRLRAGTPTSPRPPRLRGEVARETDRNSQVQATPRSPCLRGRRNKETNQSRPLWVSSDSRGALRTALHLPCLQDKIAGKASQVRPGSQQTNLRAGAPRPPLPPRLRGWVTEETVLRSQVQATPRSPCLRDKEKKETNQFRPLGDWIDSSGIPLTASRPPCL